MQATGLTNPFLSLLQGVLRIMPRLLCNQRLLLEVECIDLANLAKWIKRWKICIVLDGLVCSIVGYFYESRLILTSPLGESKYKRRVKVSLDTTR